MTTPKAAADRVRELFKCGECNWPENLPDGSNCKYCDGTGILVDTIWISPVVCALESYGREQFNAAIEAAAHLLESFEFGKYQNSPFFQQQIRSLKKPEGG